MQRYLDLGVAFYTITVYKHRVALVDDVFKISYPFCIILAFWARLIESGFTLILGNINPRFGLPP